MIIFITRKMTDITGKMYLLLLMIPTQIIEEW